jgi:nicotinate-nucleotide adenylyltransferase
MNSVQHDERTLKSRVALFGGTFDPIHRGHLAIASAAANVFALETVLFAPVGKQPLKLEGTLAGFADRLEMVTLACRADPRFAASRLDAPHVDGSVNYTVDALTELRREMPDATLFVLVGADSFLELRQWRKSDQLLELAEWIVVSRPGFSLNDFAGLGLSGSQMGRVHVLNSVHEEVSATELRKRLRSGDDCGDLIPAVVAEYIRAHRLYED